MEKKGEIKKRGRTLRGRSTKWFYGNYAALRGTVPAYLVCTFGLLTLSKTPFHPKFHTFAVKIGQNKNKIGDIKITKDSLRKLDLHLER